MPNFGVNDNDRRTAEAMERIWAARRKEQVMSSVYTDEQFDKMILAMGPFSTSEQRMIDYALALRQRAEKAHNEGKNAALKEIAGWLGHDTATFASVRKWIDEIRQRAERAEADRKLIGGYLEQVLGNMMQSTGHERDEWKKSAHPLLAAALGRAK